MLPQIIIQPISTGAFSFGTGLETAVSKDALAKIKQSINPVYLPHLHSTKRTQIIYGGASSGKSVFVAQRLVVDLIEGFRNYLVCRAVANTLFDSVFAEVQGVIDDFDLHDLFDVHLTRKIITCIATKKQAIFKGLDKVEKIKSIRALDGSITDVLVEEATETFQADIKQLLKRQRGGDGEIKKRITFVFNPILQSHWIFKTYFSSVQWADDQTQHNDDRLSILKTWYIHNEYLTDDDVYDLESEPDEYMYDVYTLGKWGVLGNVIFNNYTVADLSDMQSQFTMQRHGIDWGFSNDPAAFNSTHYDKRTKTLYIFEEFNAIEISNEFLAETIRPYVGNDTVVCDSAEPKSIAEFRELGIRAIGAKKGKGSIESGIKWLKAQNIIIDKSCIKTLNEFQLYSWKQDKYGEATATPQDKNNHHIDEIRYQYEDMFGKKRARAFGHRTGIRR